VWEVAGEEPCISQRACGAEAVWNFFLPETERCNDLCEKLLRCCFLFMGIDFCFDVFFGRSADMNLQEEEILKLASLGNHGNLQNAVDVLKRSLAMRNKYANLLHILIRKQFAHV